MSLNIQCPLHMEDVRNFARRHDCEAALDAMLEYLSNYGEQENVCELHHDMAPYSFAFLMRRPCGKAWFNGGLIYSGPGEDGNPSRLDGSWPALTVSLDVDQVMGGTHQWSIHT